MSIIPALFFPTFFFFVYFFFRFQNRPSKFSIIFLKKKETLEMTSSPVGIA